MPQTKTIAYLANGATVVVNVTCQVMEDNCPLNNTDVQHTHFGCTVCGQPGGVTVTDPRPEWNTGDGFLSCCWCGIGG